LTVVEDSRRFVGSVKDQDEQATRLLVERYNQILSKVQRDLADLGEVQDDALARLYRRERLLTIESTLRGEIARVSGPMAVATAASTQI
jgi:hypothetical protein